MIRAIVFDFDGVILDSVGIKTRAFMRLFEGYGDEVVEKVIAHHEANGGISRFRKFEYIYEHFLKKPLGDEEKARLGEEFMAMAFEEVIKAEWIPGALEFLQKYSDRYACFVASGTPQEELRRIVDARGLNSFFVETFGSPTAKPDIVRDILKRHGFEAGEVAFIGDATTDYDAAMETGLRFFGVESGGQNPFPAGTQVLPDLRGLAEALAVTR